MFSEVSFGTLVSQGRSTSLKGINPENIEVVYDRSRADRILQAHDLLTRGKTEMQAWYQQTYGESFNSFQLGDRKPAVVKFLFEHPSYRSGAETLGLDNLITTNPDHFNLPWWLERGLAEARFDVDERSGRARITVVDNHSLATQAVRKGVDLGVRPGVLAGLVKTSPCNQYPQGALVVGVRGGNHFPNILHVPAGALIRDQDFLDGKSTIAAVFQRTELKEELGVLPEHIVGGVQGIRMHSHHIDRLLDGNAALFGFSCELNVTAAGLREVWAANKHPDKQEHRAILFVPYTAEHLGLFVRQTFKGKPKNDLNRLDSDRVLSFHAALPLAIEAGMSLGDLAKLCSDKLV